MLFIREYVNRVLLIGLLILSGLGLSAQTLIEVSNVLDVGTGSLRAAIGSAISGDTITFNTSLSEDTILLLTGRININKDITIRYTEPGFLTIDGNNSTGIFQISSSSDVRIAGLRFINGNANSGGALKNSGTLEVEGVIIENCSADLGGAIANNGSELKIISCLFQNNFATISGGALYSGFGDVSVQSVGFINNQAVLAGGGINIESGSFSILNSTIRANQVTGIGEGGAARFAGDTDMHQCIIDSNISNGNAGAILFEQGANSISDIRFSFNQAALDFGAVEIKAGLLGSEISQFSNCTFEYNTALGNGGAIGLTATDPGHKLILDSCNLNYNLANLDGGALWLGNGKLAAYSCQMGNNRAYFAGGAVYISDLHDGALISRSSLITNTGDIQGGALFSDGNCRIEFSTLSSNFTFGEGGGIYSHARIELAHSTISYNSSFYDGGGIFHAAGPSELSHTIISQNSSAFGDLNISWLVPLSSNGYNLFGLELPTLLPILSSDIISFDAGLENLESPDGLTFSHPLSNSSLALNSGDELLATNLDQHNNPIFGLNIDRGAREQRFCEVPKNLSVSLGISAATISWDPVPGALGYMIQGSQVGIAVSGSLLTISNSKAVGGLLPATFYEWKVKAKCAVDLITEFSLPDTFITPSLLISPLASDKTMQSTSKSYFENCSSNFMSDQLAEGMNFSNWTLYDLMGREIKQGEIYLSSALTLEQLNIPSQLSAGNYLLILESENKQCSVSGRITLTQ